jgi:hypothetical protein
MPPGSALNLAVYEGSSDLPNRSRTAPRSEAASGSPGAPSTTFSWSSRNSPEQFSLQSPGPCVKRQVAHRASASFAARPEARPGPAHAASAQAVASPLRSRRARRIHRPKSARRPFEAGSAAQDSQAVVLARFVLTDMPCRLLQPLHRSSGDRYSVRTGPRDREPLNHCRIRQRWRVRSLPLSTVWQSPRHNVMTPD